MKMQPGNVTAQQAQITGLLIFSCVVPMLLCENTASKITELYG